MKKVAALFVEEHGVYAQFPDVDMWPEARDARLYNGTLPVVCHSPCQLWVNMAAVNWQRYQRQLPAWYPGGTDGGCFAAALAAVRRWGGVLEHPASSHSWAAHGLLKPYDKRRNYLAKCASEGRCSGWWYSGQTPGEWTAEVWQSAYGHAARKRTWLLYCGKQPPFELDWRREPGTHQVGWFDRKKPTLSKKLASATPIAFARELVRLAAWSKA